jgi:hypothetical protein
LKVNKKPYITNSAPTTYDAPISIKPISKQLGNLLRVTGAEGSDATTEAVDGRAKAMQLDVVGFGESRMWDGCVEIVLGFDTKDG